MPEKKIQHLSPEEIEQKIKGLDDEQTRREEVREVRKSLRYKIDNPPNSSWSKAIVAVQAAGKPEVEDFKKSKEHAITAFNAGQIAIYKAVKSNSLSAVVPIDSALGEGVQKPGDGNTATSIFVERSGEVETDYANYIPGASVATQRIVDDHGITRVRRFDQESGTTLYTNNIGNLKYAAKTTDIATKDLSKAVLDTLHTIEPHVDEVPKSQPAK